MEESPILCHLSIDLHLGTLVVNKKKRTNEMVIAMLHSDISF
jgi:hypothetical protein